MRNGWDRYQTPRGQEKLARRMRNESIETRIRNAAKARAREFARERMERTADRLSSGGSFAAVPQGILGGTIIAIVAVTTGVSPALLVAFAAVAVVLTLVQCVRMARTMTTVTVGCGKEEEEENS